ncbi:MAG TPA: SDR family NAD(P)-dependent oxidoreductase [candidate division Zixibacteria bacterium]|nr:SDR family NAD(P)-dependent oxidoreductase [candidate division Zixibacteria bacterium]
MRVLVTGASGFIGRCLVQRLVTQGYEVVLLFEGPTGVKPSIPNQLAEYNHQIQTISGDLRDRALVANLVQESKPDSAIHLAAVGVTDPFLDYETAIEHNVLGTANLAKALFDAENGLNRARQLIVARTPGENSNMNVYSASKSASWSFCTMFAHTRGWPISGAVIYQAYGPDQPVHTFVPAAMSAALAGKDFKMTSGAQIRDWIYIDDVAQGLVAALDSDLAPGKSFDLGSGKATAIFDLVQMIYRLVDRGGRPLVGALPDRPGEAQKQVADAARSEKLLGWRSTTSIVEGLTKVMDSLDSPD